MRLRQAGIYCIVPKTINIAGVRSGSNAQTVLMLLKLASFSALIVAGIVSLKVFSP